MPDVSVIIETSTAGDWPGHCATERIVALLARLRDQTYPQERIELLVAADAHDVGLERFLAETFPGVRMVFVQGASHFSMKNAGLRAATGDILAFTDADCLPCREWVERIVSSISAGADVAVGKTRYRVGGPLAAALSVFDFGHVQAGAAGQATGFNANNVAFRRGVLDGAAFDERIERFGSCYMLARRLQARGCPMAYDPKQFVEHGYEDVAGIRCLAKHFRRGFDNTLLFRLDAEGITPGAKYIKLGLLAPAGMALSRMLFDARRIIANRKDLGVRLWAVPFYYAVSVVLRTTEAVGGLAAILNPGLFRRARTRVV